jgi:hypothetical protein
MVHAFGDHVIVAANEPTQVIVAATTAIHAPDGALAVFGG